MNFEIRLVKSEEIVAVMDIIEYAKILLKEQSEQWQHGYPNEAVLLDDIAKNRLYGAYSPDGVLAGIAAIIVGLDTDYIYIEDGNWLSPTAETDVVVHRVATNRDFFGKGVAKSLFLFAMDYAKKIGAASLKGDTHKNNKPMQKVFDSVGMSYRGVIYIADEKSDNARVAYEILVDSSCREGETPETQKEALDTMKKRQIDIN